MYYNFLVIAILFSLPGAFVWLCRRDLRLVIKRVVPLALPFAFSEFLFFPEYWEPRFLFDLGPRIGFGIEDFIFVAGLSAFASTAYAVFNKRFYRPVEAITKAVFIKRCIALFGLTLLLVIGAALLDIPMIYGSCIVMTAVTAMILAIRRDLMIPACLGAVYTMVLYCGICLLCLLLMPGLFENVWHAERFSNIHVVCVPLEELLYGAAAGLCATAVYPYLFGQTFDIPDEGNGT